MAHASCKERGIDSFPQGAFIRTIDLPMTTRKRAPTRDVLYLQLLAFRVTVLANHRWKHVLRRSLGRFPMCQLSRRDALQAGARGSVARVSGKNFLSRAGLVSARPEEPCPHSDKKSAPDNSSQAPLALFGCWSGTNRYLASRQQGYVYRALHHALWWDQVSTRVAWLRDTDGHGGSLFVNDPRS